MDIIVALPNKLECLPLTAIHFQPSLFLVALSANIRLGCKLMTLENTLAYCNIATITALKRFILQAIEILRGCLFRKRF